jgi:DedD protein
MALFKLRKKVEERKAASAPTESIEALRRRARHRLIGAAVLVLAGVVGFPLLFDTQPRPLSVDIPIEIPDRNKVAPLPPLPAAPAAQGKVGQAPAPAPAAAPKPAAEAAAAAVADTKPAPEPKPAAAPAPAPAEKAAKAEPAPDKTPPEKTAADKTAKAEPAAPKKPEATADAARAKALLEGKTVDASAGRFVVQVGAFAEKDKAHQAQVKLDRAGLKNYTQVAETSGGKRIRVRAGPFATRAEADQAAAKIKSLDLPVRILSL